MAEISSGPLQSVRSSLQASRQGAVEARGGASDILRRFVAAEDREALASLGPVGVQARRLALVLAILAMIIVAGGWL